MGEEFKLNTSQPQVYSQPTRKLLGSQNNVTAPQVAQGGTFPSLEFRQTNFDLTSQIESLQKLPETYGLLSVEDISDVITDGDPQKTARFYKAGIASKDRVQADFVQAYSDMDRSGVELNVKDSPYLKEENLFFA